MSPETMRRNCEALLACLDELELHLTKLAKKNQLWLYKSMHETRELKHIAEFESIRMTSEQIRHYVDISTKAAELCAAIPIESSDNLGGGLN